MNWQFVEEQIKRAQQKGDFDNLEGMGKPLPPDEFQHLPPEMRMAMRILKNAGYDSEAQFIQQELTELNGKLKNATGEERRLLENEYNKKLTLMNRTLSKKDVNTNSSVFKQYQIQIEDRFKWD